MITLDFVTDFMYGNFEQVKVTRHGTHFLARCPLCGDSKKNRYKKRFNLDYFNGVPGWRCFNCDRQGNIYDIYSRLKGVSYEDAVGILKEGDNKWGRGDTKRTKKVREWIENKKPKKEEIVYNKYNWIKKDCDTKSLPERYVEALVKFYHDRKIPLSYPLYIAYQGKYKNRIIIPVLDAEGDIVYFQGRRIPTTGLEPKFKNPPDPKEIVIMNEHLFEKGKPIVVTEGITDCVLTGTQSTSCLGKYLYDELLQKLLVYTDDIVVALDNDDPAYESLSKFMKESMYAAKAKYFLYPSEYSKYKDLGDIVENEDIEDLYSFIISNSTSYSTAKIKLSLKEKKI